MKLDIDPVFTTDPPVFLLKDLTVRPLKEEEHCKASQLLEQQHEQCNLSGAVVTADALHNSQPDAQAILDTGADYVLQIKQENRHSYKAAEQIAQSIPPFTHTEEPDGSHARIDTRTVKVYSVEPVQSGLPGARTLIIAMLPA